MGLKEWFIKRAVKSWLDKQKKGQTKMWKALENKKNYVCYGLIAVSAIVQILQAFHVIPNVMPDAAYGLLDVVFASLGFGARAETQTRINAALKQLGQIQVK
jgi:hypothetical protein